MSLSCVFGCGRGAAAAGACHASRTSLGWVQGESGRSGAYKGRGGGTAFLNDLCDADALIHVVDASGTTDTGGGAAKAGEGADPCDDVRRARGCGWGAHGRQPLR